MTQKELSGSWYQSEFTSFGMDEALCPEVYQLYIGRCNRLQGKKGLKPRDKTITFECNYLEFRKQCPCKLAHRTVVQKSSFVKCLERCFREVDLARVSSMTLFSRAPLVVFHRRNTSWRR